MVGWLPAASAALALAVAAVPVPGQAGSGAAGSPFADARAEDLWEAGAAHRVRMDDALVQYVALVKERVAAGLRMPLKDRTLYRAESAGRVVWTRGGTTVVQVLGGREQTPVGPLRGVVRPGIFDFAFDPLHDRLFFGLAPANDVEDADGEDFWFEHPLVAGWRDGYRFQTGDSITLSLPDGRRLRAVELQVVPAEADVHRMVGSLWIEPESGALVRAVYRLSRVFDAFRDLPDLREEEDEDLRHVPELLKPWTFDLSMVAVDYAWWEGDVWLPRTLRAEGTARAGFLRAPATVELSYAVESVVTEADLAARDRTDEADAGAGSVEEHHFRTRGEAMAFLADRLGGDVPYRLEGGWSRRDGPRGGRTVRYLVPRDTSRLRTSPDLPPPVWEDGAGFPGEDEVGAWEQALRDLPSPRQVGGATPRTFRWGLQRTDLVRYNRVEGLSVGARAQLRPRTPVGPLSLTATARLGTADQVPNLKLEATRETLARRLTASVYHELAAVDPRARHLGPGNSVTALLFGRDDGDYYRRSGASLRWTPPSARRASFEVRSWAEYHGTVAAETDFALWHLTDDSLSFRENLEAREGWEVGGGLRLRPWWGTDPRLAQGGLELAVDGAGGDWEYLRASLEGRVAVPLPADLRVALEAGAGTSWGDPPLQRRFLLGGARTLRGYGGATLVGSTYLRTRAELARHFAFGSVSLFSDGAWAAEERRSVDPDEILWSAGLGLSLVDGLIRLDGAWGLRDPRDFRLELYLDGIL